MGAGAWDPPGLCQPPPHLEVPPAVHVDVHQRPELDERVPHAPVPLPAGGHLSPSVTHQHPPTVPPGPLPGQVAPRPALQENDLSAEGAEAPLDEEGASVALERERGQVMGTGSLALQRLVQLLLQEELGAGGDAVSPPPLATLPQGIPGAEPSAWDGTLLTPT